MINLHLFIPSLFWHDTSLPEIYRELPISDLEAMLAKSSMTKELPQKYEAWLCNTFKVTKQQNWPIAPITLKAENSSMLFTDKDFWMRADPVHLRIEQNHILLADNQVLNIAIKESKQLADTLNDHFANRGLEFLLMNHDRWYIKLRKTPDMKTYELSHITGKNINNFLPSGEDSKFWHHIFNEIQMLLHEHPINLARLARKELPINSVWFWGGGVMPASCRSPFLQIWSDEFLSSALALASGTKHAKLPPNAKTWQQSTAPGDHLVVIDRLWKKAQYNDTYGWREAFKQLEKNWLSPLFATIQEGNLNTLTITSTNENATRNFTISRKNLWKFWRVTKPLSIYT
ncbi:MAG: phosphoglycerate mutase [Nitrosomonas sp.]|nr:phosphoglycerate mutase [Nitrosomonas sp.]